MFPRYLVQINTRGHFGVPGKYSRQFYGAGELCGAPAEDARFPLHLSRRKNHRKQGAFRLRSLIPALLQHPRIDVDHPSGPAERQQSFRFWASGNLRRPARFSMCSLYLSLMISSYSNPLSKWQPTVLLLWFSFHIRISFKAIFRKGFLTGRSFPALC